MAPSRPMPNKTSSYETLFRAINLLSSAHRTSEVTGLGRCKVIHIRKISDKVHARRPAKPRLSLEAEKSSPIRVYMVGPGGLEPPTKRL